MDRIQPQLFCLFRQFKLTCGRTVLGVYPHFKVFLGRIGQHFTQQLGKLCGVLGFFMYLQPQADKAQNGRIVVKGDYVLLVIAGDNDRIANGEVDKVYAEIDKAINDALA